MAYSVVSVAANGQQQTVLGPSGSLSGSAVTPVTSLVGSDGVTPIAATNPLQMLAEGAALSGCWQFGVTTSPVAIGTLPVSYIWLQYDPANTNSVYIGTNTSQYYVMNAANPTWSGAITNANQIYAKTATGTANLNVLTRSQ